jgi:hypothetical protein
MAQWASATSAISVMQQLMGRSCLQIENQLSHLFTAWRPKRANGCTGKAKAKSLNLNDKFSLLFDEHGTSLFYDKSFS